VLYDWDWQKFAKRHSSSSLCRARRNIWRGRFGASL
jgi:hypothetical protein